jgi:hypothetical protein
MSDIDLFAFTVMTLAVLGILVPIAVLVAWVLGYMPTAYFLLFVAGYILAIVT